MIGIEEILADHQAKHSDLQMDYFITTRHGGTVYGMYKQALRELHSRHTTLQGLYIDHDEALMAYADAGKGWVFNARQRRSKAIRKERTTMALRAIRTSIKDTERERDRFLAQARLLKHEVGELTPAKRAVLDGEMWTHKIKSMAAMDYMTAGVLGRGTIELLQCVPNVIRRKLLAEVCSAQAATQLRTWFLDYNADMDEKLLPERGE